MYQIIASQIALYSQSRKFQKGNYNDHWRNAEVGFTFKHKKIQLNSLNLGCYSLFMSRSVRTGLGGGGGGINYV